jgi:DNA end-binding protein Ku
MRSIWTGHIAFGLISIPVKLYSAVSDDRIHFSMLHEKDGAHIKYKRVSETSGKEVPWDEIVKGYEVTKGEYVTFTHDELDELDVKTMRVIDIDTFVELEDIDPIYYDTTYYVGAGEGGEKAYQLLVRALKEQGRVGIAKFAMREKEHLCALRVKDDMFVLETMHWPAEIRDPDVDGPDAKVQIREREVEMAMNLVDQLTGPFEPERYRNTFEQHLKKAAEAKLEGKEVTRAPEAEEGEPVSDLMELLRQSLDASKRGSKTKRQPRRRTSKAKSTTTSKASSTSTSKSTTAKPRSKAWLLDQPKSKLEKLAQEQDIEGRSKMTKDELVDALRS